MASAGLFARLWPGGHRRRRRATLAAFRRAESLRRGGRPARAMAHVRRGLTLDPESLTGHLLAAYLYAGERASALARAEFHWVLRRHPAHPRALLGLARIALEEGDVALCRDGERTSRARTASSCSCCRCRAARSGASGSCR